ncbi:DUF4336 domain-containing protein [Cyanobacterium aponinum UTEX 3221]|uniref:DUF4336 domain-containing protein n=1 Tax=Cyanobacterium aponinum TaxID=379064 RepID=UPI002B4BCB16|nr:DUF4336 domain-containing protein [Cyanobacterium aponinum]WRL37252.1 DUF4336 domain-containing protein [Cyanobacterium aponinum UTEX 3221]
MLKQIDSDIWVAEQPLKYLGINVGTRMTVIRSNSDQLSIISPIQINDAIKKQLETIGVVTNIIAPNLFHYLFASDCKNLFPYATFWADLDLKKKKPDLPIDKTFDYQGGNLNDHLKYMFFDGFKTITLNGFSRLNEFIFYHPTSRTLILTDIAFNFDKSFSFSTKLVSRLIGGYNNLSPSLLEKIATTNKNKIKSILHEILDWDFDRVIMAHGSIIESNGKEKLIKGFENF